MNLNMITTEQTKSSITTQIISALPPYFRVTDINAAVSPKGNKIASAHLSHYQAEIKVIYQLLTPENEIKAGDLVEIVFEQEIRSYGGSLVVSGLKVISSPNSSINLFHTVPSCWLKQRSLVTNAAELFDKLPDYFKILLNGVFWDSDKFKHFITGPSSMQGHHHYLNGNLIHTLDVVERSISMSSRTSKSNLAIVMMGAWMHDAGKADEYHYDQSKHCFEMSDRGILIGHKVSVIEWMAAAKAKYAIEIPDQVWLSLLHTLTAIKGAPDWMGFREPITPESLIISTADRLSAQHDLFEQTATEQNGFGKYHRHLKGKPYVLVT